MRQTPMSTEQRPSRLPSFVSAIFLAFGAFSCFAPVAVLLVNPQDGEPIHYDRAAVFYLYGQSLALAAYDGMAERLGRKPVSFMASRDSDHSSRGGIGLLLLCTRDWLVGFVANGGRGLRSSCLALAVATSAAQLLARRIAIP